MNASFAQTRPQYEIKDLSASIDLVRSLADAKVNKNFTDLMTQANTITKIIEKNDVLVADVIRKIFIVEAKFCSLKLRGCVGGGRLTIEMSQGTFLPPGMEAKPSYDSKVEMFR